MFQAPTVFVIGAGASASFGFPTGAKLLAEIRAALGDPYINNSPQYGYSEPFNAFFESHGGKRPSVADFLDSFRQRLLAYRSIDDFIYAQENEESEELAKLLIARSISIHERHSAQDFQAGRFGRVDFSAHEDKWPFQILVHMFRGVRRNNIETAAKNVGFISFNYDRSFEHFVYQWLMNVMQVDDATTRNFIASIPIFHPYGTIGRLNWQDQKEGTQYGNVPSRFGAVARYIRTYNEQLSDERELDGLKTLVGQAEKLVFMGFGFHKQNVDLLMREERPPNLSATYSTIFQADTQEQSRVQKIMQDRFSGYVKDHGTMDCNHFAKSFLPLIAED